LLKQGGVPDDVSEEAIVENILLFIKPILSEIAWVCKEISASHVLRSILSLLAGLPVISEKRGKNAKHQHSISLSEPLDAMLLEPEKFYLDNKYCFDVPESFHGNFF
jgi:hypothetical protein